MVRPTKSIELKKLSIKSKIVAESGKEIKITSRKVKTIFQTSVSPNSSGGYISIPQKFNYHKAFVVIMEEKVDGK
jgi:putative transposon-encoded protein